MSTVLIQCIGCSLICAKGGVMNFVLPDEQQRIPISTLFEEFLWFYVSQLFEGVTCRRKKRLHELFLS